MAEPTQTDWVLTPARLDRALLDQLQTISTLAAMGEPDLPCLEGAQWMILPAGITLPTNQGGHNYFYALLEGEISLTKQDAEQTHLIAFHGGEAFGEVPLLCGRNPVPAHCHAVQASRLLRIPEDSFWKLLAQSPQIRTAVLHNYALRYETYQAMTLHREKLVSLGTLAAGLMHELNNPGSAARRAAGQLRENLSRLQQISLRMTRAHLSADQMECLATLQEQVMELHQPVSLSALEQSDREEELSAWLEQLEIENPWRLAPTLVSAGWTHEDISCARHSFPPGTLSDALNYLDALISSMQHVATVEESITRVTDLVLAVKKYAYDDKQRQPTVDVRDSLLSTLTILGHKFREKGIRVESELPPSEAKISCVGTGLTQVWTNLLDNAIDAAPEHGTVGVRLWTEGKWLCVGIRDNGPGIAPEHREHIFEPFYTTKEAGVGTGLGLDIVHRIVVGNFRGEIQFESEPGEGTEFLVRLPVATEGSVEREGCSTAGLA